MPLRRTERRALARIERELRRDDPGLDRALTGVPEVPWTWTAACASLVLLTGDTALLATGVRLDLPLLLASAVALFPTVIAPQTPRARRLARSGAAWLAAVPTPSRRNREQVPDATARRERSVAGSDEKMGDVTRSSARGEPSTEHVRADVSAAEAVDPDVDLHVPAQRRERHLDVLAVIAAGGILGAEARYGVGLALPHAPAAFPWSTLLINAAGCFLIGILMILITEMVTAPRLLRPFLGVGVLGGFTTFSTYAVDTQRLLVAGRPAIALAYAAGTLAAAMAAVWVGANLTRAVTGLLAERLGMEGP